MRLDPTRTGMIARSFIADLRRRFSKLNSDVWAYVATTNSAGLNEPQQYNPFKTNASFSFDTDNKKLKDFNAWLQSQVNQGILSASPTNGEPLGLDPWLYKYVQSSYKQAAIQTYIAARPQLQKPMPQYEGSRADFLESSFGAPERVSKLRMLYTRSYENLKGITAQMSAQMSRTMADGMAQGKGAMEVARELSKINGISVRRSKVLARTELVHAHAEGALDTMEDLGIKQTSAELEFLTADDDGVCPVCKKLNGKVYTIPEARGIIPVHPNCRCAWKPHIVVPKFKFVRKNGRLIPVLQPA